jgi:hypothetical protein
MAGYTFPTNSHLKPHMKLKVVTCALWRLWTLVVDEVVVLKEVAVLGLLSMDGLSHEEVRVLL